MEGVSVVVITLNEEKNIPHILEDLACQSFGKFEVIVADGGSTDATVAAARSFAGRLPELRVIEMSRGGVGLGRNTGAAEARNERLLFLDADTRLDGDFLEKSLFELQERSLDVGGVYMKCPGASLPLALGVGMFNAGLWLGQRHFPMAVGACLFSTRTVHRDIGGFDESITLCEDCDYVCRASKREGTRFGMLNQKFAFHTRRLDQEGLFRTGWTYLRANLHRMFLGELHGNPYRYRFGHYDTPKAGNNDA